MFSGEPEAALKAEVAGGDGTDESLQRERSLPLGLSPGAPPGEEPTDLLGFPSKGAGGFLDGKPKTDLNDAQGSEGDAGSLIEIAAIIGGALYYGAGPDRGGRGDGVTGRIVVIG